MSASMTLDSFFDSQRSSTETRSEKPGRSRSKHAEAGSDESEGRNDTEKSQVVDSPSKLMRQTVQYSTFDPRFVEAAHERLSVLRQIQHVNGRKKKSYLVHSDPVRSAPQVGNEEDDEPYSKRKVLQAAALGRVTVLAARMRKRYTFGLPATVCLFVQQLRIRCETVRRERCQARRRSIMKRMALVTSQRVGSPDDRNSTWSLSGRIELAIQRHGVLGIAGASAAMQGGVAFATRSTRANVPPARALASRLEELEQDLSSQMS